MCVCVCVCECVCAPHRELVDGDGGDGRGVAPQLPDEHEAREVPDDAGAVPGPAHHHVIGGGGGQADHLQHHPLSLTHT